MAIPLSSRPDNGFRVDWLERTRHAGGVDYQEISPPEALRPLVKAGWTLRAGSAASLTIRHAATPDGCVEIIRRLEGRSSWGNAQPETLRGGARHPSGRTGAQRRFPVRRPSTLAVGLEPAGACPLLGPRRPLAGPRRSRAGLRDAGDGRGGFRGHGRSDARRRDGGPGLGHRRGPDGGGAGPGQRPIASLAPALVRPRDRSCRRAAICACCASSRRSPECRIRRRAWPRKRRTTASPTSPTWRASSEPLPGAPAGVATTHRQGALPLGRRLAQIAHPLRPPQQQTAGDDESGAAERGGVGRDRRTRASPGRPRRAAGHRSSAPPPRRSPARPRRRSGCGPRSRSTATARHLRDHLGRRPAESEARRNEAARPPRPASGAAIAASRNCITITGAAPAAIRFSIISHDIPKAAPIGKKAARPISDHVRPEHDQHPGEGEQGRHPGGAVRALAEHQRRQQGGEDRAGELDRGGVGERHRHHAQEEAQGRERHRRAAPDLQPGPAA